MIHNINIQPNINPCNKKSKTAVQLAAIEANNMLNSLESKNGRPRAFDPLTLISSTILPDAPYYGQNLLNSER